MTANLNWTGHALVDVGIATLCAIAEKDDPGELTLEDLDRACDEMEAPYTDGRMMSYLTCVFPNSGYVNATMLQPKKTAYLRRVLRGHRSKPDIEAEGRRCVFSGLPATHLVDRGQIPLLTGEGVLNFFPDGLGGCLIAGQYLTALQVLPLGGRRTDGRLLVAHADNPKLTLAFARRYLIDNRRYIGLGESIKEGHPLQRAKNFASKFPDASSAPSLITSDLISILKVARDAGGAHIKGSVTAYWLTNSGQGPALDIFIIPSSLVVFLHRLQEEGLQGAWNRLVFQGWPDTSEEQNSTTKKKGKAQRKSLKLAIGPGRTQNRVLEDLLKVFVDGTIYYAEAGAFVRRHLLRVIGSEQKLRSPHHWKFTELFLTEVLGMDKQRLEKIRDFADKLAVYIKEQNDKPLLHDILYKSKSWELRNTLTKAQRNEMLKGKKLLFGLEEYVAVFEAEDSVGALSWSLVRDLISIRLIEKLHELGWGGIAEVVQDEPDSEEEVAVLNGEEEKWHF
jgi:CRISPR-associated protein Cst1